MITQLTVSALSLNMYLLVYININEFVALVCMGKFRLESLIKDWQLMRKNSLWLLATERQLTLT